MDQIIQFISALSQTVSLEMYTFIGSVIEEIVAPVPSPLIMTTAGSLALTQNQPPAFLFWLSAVASLGKTAASWVFYAIADRSEYFILSTFGKYIGFTHKELERVSRHFNGTRRDDFFVFLARAIPIAPTTLVSAACGFLHLRLSVYLVATFLGYYIRSFLFVYLGYIGLRSIGVLPSELNMTESALKIALYILLTINILWILYRHNKVTVQKWYRKIILKERDE